MSATDVYVHVRLRAKAAHRERKVCDRKHADGIDKAKV